MDYANSRQNAMRRFFLAALFCDIIRVKGIGMSEHIIAVIMGFVEGATEFLPVSSTGHLILTGYLLGYEGETASVFEVFIQLGAILAVFLLYLNKFRAMLLPAKRRLATRGMTVYHVLAGSIPVMAVGYLLHKPIKAYLFSPATVVIGLVVGGIFMIAAEKLAAKHQVHDVDDISLAQAFWVGLFQCLSLWPGFSRSGATIGGGLFFGLDRRTAAEFSFIVAVPVMFAAGVYDLLKAWNKLSTGDLWTIAIGFVVSFIFAYLSVVWLLRVLNRTSLSAFAYYRFVVAALSYWVFLR